MRTKKEWIKILGKPVYRKLRNKLAMKYRRFNRGENWKTETLIDGLTFEQALQRAYDEALKRIELGLPKDTYKVKTEPEKSWLDDLGETEKTEDGFNPDELLKKAQERAKEPHDNTGFSDLEPLLRKTFGKSEEELAQESKRLENAINESLERQTVRGLCPRCKSSVCRCSQNSQREGE